MRRLRCLPIAALAAVAVAAPASAHGIDVDVIARGLDNPRHVAVAKNGDVYVAESGRGGDHATARSCFDSPEGFACTGRTGAITRIGRRHQERVVRGLASFAPVTGDNAIGPHGVFASGGDVYFTNGGPTAPTRGTPPQVVLRDPTLVAEDPISALYGVVFKLRSHGRIQPVADAWAFERAVNPDRVVGNELIDSNPVDVLEDRGRLVIADAGGNSVIRTGHKGRLEVLSLFPNIPTPAPDGSTIPMQAVPTGVVEGPDGFYYVSQLTGFPFPVGGAKVFRVDPRSGRYTTFATGFTNIIDLDFGDDGTLYVLELDSDSILGGSRDGGLWAVTRWGNAHKVELPAGTLVEPGGIAAGRHGTLYVSNHSREAGAGEVLRIDLDRRW
jgi:hypothetical protein